MTHVPSDVSGNSSAAQNGRGRGETVQMNPAILGQAARPNPEAEAIRQLDMASAMLGEAVTYGVIPAQSRDRERGGRGEPDDRRVNRGAIARRTSGPTMRRTRRRTPSRRLVRPLLIPLSHVARRHLLLQGGSRPHRPRRPIRWRRIQPLNGNGSKYRASMPRRDFRARELANISARSSFNVHRGRQLVYEMHNKLTVSLVAAVVVSFALTALTSSRQSLAYFAAKSSRC